MNKKYLCRFVFNNSLEVGTVFLKIHFKGEYYYIPWKRDHKNFLIMNNKGTKKLRTRVYIRSWNSLDTLTLNILQTIELGDSFFNMIQSDDQYTRQIARVILYNQLENYKDIKL